MTRVRTIWNATSLRSGIPYPQESHSTLFLQKAVNITYCIWPVSLLYKDHSHWLFSLPLWSHRSPMLCILTAFSHTRGLSSLSLLFLISSPSSLCLCLPKAFPSNKRLWKIPSFQTAVFYWWQLHSSSSSDQKPWPSSIHNHIGPVSTSVSLPSKHIQNRTTSHHHLY